MTSIEFKKTGNFWLDNGIVGLYKILRKIYEDSDRNYELNLSPSSLILKSSIEDTIEEEPHSDLISILEKARNRLSQEYVSISIKNYRWYYEESQEQFFVFAKSSYKNHLRGTFFNAKPEYEGTLYLPDKEKEVLDKIPKKKNMNEETYQKFLKFKNDNQEIFDKKMIAKERDEGFINNPSKYTFGDVLSSKILKKGIKKCGFSGFDFSDTIDVNGMYSPFITGTSGELNFSSFLEKKLKISSFYAFVALFAPFNLSYNIQNSLSNYFIFYDSNLKELNSFYNDIEHNINELKNSDYCNFATYVTGTQYEAESLFNFLISVYKQVKAKLARDTSREVFTKSVFTLSNDGKIFRDVKEYTSLASLFGLFDAFHNHFENKAYFDEFLNLIRFFNKKVKNNPPEYDTTWRNRLCTDILSFRSILKTIEWFIGEVKMKEESGNIAFLDKLIEIYNHKTQINMKSEMVDLCKRVGNNIGCYCQENKDKGILFSIRNAKNRAEFLNVLAETQFRTEVLYSEEFFKELPEDTLWEEYKALVSIFAMNKYLSKKKEEPAKQ